MTEKKQAQVEQHQKRLDGKLAMERKKKRKSDEVKWRKTYDASLTKKGATIIRKQRQLLMKKFPDSNGELTKEEKGAYKAYKNTLSPERKKELEDRDGLVDQPCVLQYISRNPRPTLNRPYGTVSYVNAKKLVRGRGQHAKLIEVMVDPPLTLAWVQFCFVFLRSTLIS
jgi:hypothetical protein